MQEHANTFYGTIATHRQSFIESHLSPGFL